MSDCLRSFLAAALGRAALLVRLRLRIAAGALSLLGMWLGLGVLHELFVMATAVLLACFTSWEPVKRAVALSPLDDVHAQLALRLIGDIQVHKLAIGVPWDTLLVAAFPDIVAPASALPNGAWISAVFAAGSSAIGVHVAGLMANVVFVVAGALLTAVAARGRSLEEVHRWPRRERAGFSLGLLAQAYGVTALVHMAGSEAGGGEIMLSFAATKILGLDRGAYELWFPGAGAPLSIIINLGLAVLGLFFALQIRRFLRIVPTSGAGFGRFRGVPLLALPAGMPGPVLLALAALLFQTPLKAMPAFEPVAIVADVGRVAGEVTPRVAGVVQAPTPRHPHRVTIERTAEGFVYRVDGARKWVRGIGYNAITLHLNSADEGAVLRAALYDRDFARMRAAGANTIVGWDQKEFDDLLLSKADQHGLGIILPFELYAWWDYNDSAVKEDLHARLRIWVERYRTHPALRMWGLGNETIHGMGNVNSPNARAFASFLIEAADLVHQLDPDHPVIYRDAEDQYLKPVAEALARDGVSRPWFVYGMNFFTYRVGPALQDGPTKRLQQPLLISEFAPAGLRSADRPAGYVKQWRLIRSFSERVLGGSAYVWTTQGPEPLDRSFGLTDEDGNPVDGALGALAAVFHEEARAAAGAPGERDRSLDGDASSTGLADSRR